MRPGMTPVTNNARTTMTMTVTAPTAIHLPLDMPAFRGCGGDGGGVRKDGSLLGEDPVLGMGSPQRRVRVT